MATTKEIIDYADDLLEIKAFHDFCPNGLLVEGELKEAKHLCSAVSTSLKVLEQAIAHQADILLVHHGLFWKGDSFCIEKTLKKKLQLLLDHGITLIGYHLPLDAHQKFGNNWSAARDLGWKNLHEFGPSFGGHALGVMGEISPQSAKDFQKTLESYYHHPAHTALGGKDTIQKVALISGGAHKEIESAIDQELDAFVTGSFDEPIWHVAFENKINFFALGHANTETVGPKSLGKHLANKFGLKHTFIEDFNPF